MAPHGAANVSPLAAQHGSLQPPSSVTQLRGMGHDSLQPSIRSMESVSRMPPHGEAYDAQPLPFRAPPISAGSGLLGSSSLLGAHHEDPWEEPYLDASSEGPYHEAPWEGPYHEGAWEGPYLNESWEGPEGFGVETDREVDYESPSPNPLGMGGPAAPVEWPYPNIPAPVYSKQCPHLALTPCTPNPHSARWLSCGGEPASHMS